MEEPADASGLWLASVVVDLDGGGPADGHMTGGSARVSELVMAVPEVVTVRPDGGATRWLYRIDVAGGARAAMERDALAPVRALERAGWRATVARLSWLSDAGRRRFHARFAGEEAARCR